MTKKIKPSLLNGTLFLAGLVPAGLLSTTALAQTPPGCDSVFDGTHVVVTCRPGQVDSENSFLLRNLNIYLDSGYAGQGNDVLNMEGGRLINAPGTIDPDDIPPGLPFDPTDGGFDFSDGDDTINMNSGAIGEAAAPAEIFFGNGNDTFTMTGGDVFADIHGGSDNDTFIFNGGILTGDVEGGAGEDSVSVGGGTINGDIYDGRDGPATALTDHFGMTAGTVNGNIYAEDTAIHGGTVNGNVTATDFLIDNGAVNGLTFATGIRVNGGTMNGEVSAIDLDMTGGTINGEVHGAVTGDSADNSFHISGGTINGNVLGDFGAASGEDSFTIDGGTINGNVDGGEDSDTLQMTAGTINGNIDVDNVNFQGGTVNGNVSGLATLLIDDAASAAPLLFADGITFSGAAVSGAIDNADLAAGGRSQTFSGFDTLFLNGSTVRFAGDQSIDDIVASGGSTIFTSGSRSIANRTGTGLGMLSLVGSSLDMMNGAATDSLTLGGLSLDNSAILVDYDQQGEAIDHIVVTPGGITNIVGANRIQVNLLGTPTLDRASDVAVIQSDSAIDPALFTIEGIGGTASSLYSYEFLGGGGGGGLTLRATPTAAPVGPVIPVSNTSILLTSIAQLNDLTSVNVADALGLTGGGGAAGAGGDGLPFGVFATGQLARTHYDGFDVVGTGLTTPSYSGTEASAAASLDWNASEYLGFDQQYGLNIGVFGGYASSNVDLGSYLGFTTAGNAVNESGLFGAYTLFRKERSYLVFSAIGLLGNTDVTNGLLGNSTGSYDTQGVAATLSAGHIFMLTDTMRLDLRGGVLAARFTGDAYTDSAGVRYGKSEVSFGGLKFEPGIYSDHKLDNGMSVSPYLRAEFQQLIGYENKASAGGRSFEFDTAGFSAALSGGINLQVTKATTLSSEVKVKASADSHSIAGKLGIKVAF